MKQLLPLLALAGAAVATHGAIEVEYVDVESFRDFRLSGQTEENTQGVFTRELGRNTRLNSFIGEHTLELTFTEIDMAGDIQPWRNRYNEDIRYVEELYAPRLEFTYVLKDAEGNELASGEETLRDGGFMWNANPVGRSDPFHYEMEMLENWARRNIRGK